MVIYLDNAATSWPKPKQMLEAMINFTNKVGANPGRSGHRLSVEAGRIICDVRENMAKLLNIEDPMHVVFGLNATDGLNLAIRGTVQKGDHVITSSMEHNSVMRPLRDLEKVGVEITVVQRPSRPTTADWVTLRVTTIFPEIFQSWRFSSHDWLSSNSTPRVEASIEAARSSA